MKVLILAISILLLTGALVAWDCWYVERTCRILTDTAARLPILTAGDNTADTFALFSENYRQFEAGWLRAEPIFHIFLGHDTADQVTAAMNDMGLRYIGGDIAGYMSARGQLLEHLERIRQAERISVDSIF